MEQLAHREVAAHPYVGARPSESARRRGENEHELAASKIRSSADCLEDAVEIGSHAPAPSHDGGAVDEHASRQSSDGTQASHLGPQPKGTCSNVRGLTHRLRLPVLAFSRFGFPRLVREDQDVLAQPVSNVAKVSGARDQTACARRAGEPVRGGDSNGVAARLVPGRDGAREMRNAPKDAPSSVLDTLGVSRHEIAFYPGGRQKGLSTNTTRTLTASEVKSGSSAVRRRDRRSTDNRTTWRRSRADEPTRRGESRRGVGVVALASGPRDLRRHGLPLQVSAPTAAPGAGRAGCPARPNPPRTTTPREIVHANVVHPRDTVRDRAARPPLIRSE